MNLFSLLYSVCTRPNRRFCVGVARSIKKQISVLGLVIAATVWGEGAFCLAGEESSPSFFVVYPSSISLSCVGEHAGFLVQRNDGRFGIGGVVSEGLKTVVADPSIADLIDGEIVARSAGETQLQITHTPTGSEIFVPIRVAGESKREWEFDAHVQSILTRASCNSGACHGALAGKGGLRLSLRGYDSLADYYALTQQDRGRRIEPADPGRSLLLCKPSQILPHKGGLRLAEGSEDFQILAEWIASGYPGPESSQARLEELQVFPESLRLHANDQQPLIVRASYTNGRTEDVTKWAKFSSTNEAVAKVSEDGQIEVVGSGKASIVIWFASRIVLSSVVVPYSSQSQGSLASDFESANLIDEILLAEWEQLGLRPSVVCSDETFMRRAFLDATGALPNAALVREFLSSDSHSRSKLVDQILGSEDYVDYWSYKWSDLLLVNGNLLRPDAVAAYYRWIRSQVEKNTPWDQFVREIVLARGESLEQGATNFYAIHQDPESLTENTCQAFLGLSIACARCHNHPLEKWTNDQYYGMANLFARVRAKGWGGDPRNGDGKRTLVVLSRGDVIQPSRGIPQPPAPLDAPAIDMENPLDRREVLADWLTSRANPYFARAIANRVWANFFGTGLVEQVDDLRISNPASSERLLNALADYLAENKYDLQALMRLIMNSRVYQLSSEPNQYNISDQRFYCHYYPRRLMAEVLHDAIVSVTGVPTAFTEVEYSGSDRRKTESYPLGTKAIELYDSAVVNYFLKSFGRHQRRITCECERSNVPTVVQVLHLSNGDTLNTKLNSQECVVQRWQAQNAGIESVVEEAFLSALTRFPSPAEKMNLATILNNEISNGASRTECYADLLWSLMTSNEFLFAH
ncbi:MAG: DUF1553 domain-containing protein [Planctomycetales bacterium]|nr:DUF1553 domain-containing protein [Planctomycetales bacterium]